MLEKHTLYQQVIAENVLFDDWLRLYAEDHTEWIEGLVIKLSPVSLEHNNLDGFLFHLLRIFLSRTKIGRVLRQPFVMRIKPGSPGREPDIHVVLNDRVQIIQDTMTAGPADIVIEIVSKESQDRDLIEKYEEYESGGVREYWLINPLRRQSDFYSLSEDGLYQRIELKNGLFHSIVLPRFHLDTSILWQPERLEDDDYIRGLVDAMLKEES